MDYNRIIQLIQNPGLLTLSDQSIIENGIKRYPFTPAFHLLQFRWEQLYSPEKADPAIERLSIYSTHREILQKINIHPLKTIKTETIPPASVQKITDETPEIQEEIINTEDIHLQETEQTTDSTDNHHENIQKPVTEKQSYINKLGISHLFFPQNTESLHHEDTTDLQKPIENTDGDIKEDSSTEKENTENSTNISVPDTIQAEKATEQKQPEEENKNSTDIPEVLTVITEFPAEEESANTENSEPQKTTIQEESANKTEPDNETLITPAEKLTFSQWISLSGKKADIPAQDNPTHEKQKDIIEKFIESNPKITPPKKEGKTKQEAAFIKDEIKDIASLMTVTLAQLYVEQGRYDTAITAFKILSLKYPEKSSYFASEIRKVKKLKNSK